MQVKAVVVSEFGGPEQLQPAEAVGTYGEAVLEEEVRSMLADAAVEIDGHSYAVGVWPLRGGANMLAHLERVLATARKADIDLSPLGPELHNGHAGVKYEL
jgi:hypothetical protein